MFIGVRVKRQFGPTPRCFVPAYVDEEGVQIKKRWVKRADYDGVMSRILDIEKRRNISSLTVEHRYEEKNANKDATKTDQTSLGGASRGKVKSTTQVESGVQPEAQSMYVKRARIGSSPSKENQSKSNIPRQSPTRGNDRKRRHRKRKQEK